MALGILIFILAYIAFKLLFHNMRKNVQYMVSGYYLDRLKYPIGLKFLYRGKTYTVTGHEDYGFWLDVNGKRKFERAKTLWLKKLEGQPLN